MQVNRRRFLQVGSLASASLMLPKFLKAMEQGNLVPPGNKVLVVVQLSGGNDGLNTVIPYRNDIYYKMLLPSVSKESRRWRSTMSWVSIPH